MSAEQWVGPLSARERLETVVKVVEGPLATKVTWFPVWRTLVVPPWELAEEYWDHLLCWWIEIGS